MEEKVVAELDPVLTKTGFTKAVEMIYEDMGSNMAKTLGVEKFGGNVQTAGVKKAGYSYWCTANKDMYLCKSENSLNYIDNSYFEAFSNASLLGKLQNLSEVDRFINKGIQISKQGATVCVNITGVPHSELINFVIPEKYRPSTTVRFVCFRYSPDEIGFYFINTNGTITFTKPMTYIDTGNVSYQN